MNTNELKTRALRDDTQVITPERVLDNNNAHQMVDAIMAAISGGCRYVIVDMSNLQLLSSAGVGSILGTIETAREKGGDIILCGVPSQILHVLQVLDLTEYLTITVTEKEAATLAGIEQ